MHIDEEKNTEDKPLASKAKTQPKKKKTLVIVESPSKANTIGKYLGSSYKVIASVGHVRDLPKSTLGIDIENDFEPKYIPIRGKGDLIKSLKKEAKASAKVLLATDPDREGEAISWHLAYLLGLDPNSNCRIEFHEITKNAISAAIKTPRSINMNLVDAQQARRILDRLVGYQISPLLWRKVSRGLSAGRVQSAALKIICDRENAINAFVPTEYWILGAEFEKKEGAAKKKFTAKVISEVGAPKKELTIGNEAEANKILEKLKEGKFTVTSVKEEPKKRNPYAPFTTSNMQQEASNKLNFPARKTMMIAQQLYEGVSIKGRGLTGLVTYIRTDSTRISDEARAAAKEFIHNNYEIQPDGSEIKYWSNNVYKNKGGIQDAHEAIRPSDVTLVPDEIKDSLTEDQYKLYKLIWLRFVASQMRPAEFMSMTADIENNGYLLRANGSKQVFDGYLKIYKSFEDDSKDRILPGLAVGEELTAKEVTGDRKFTQPPSRYTEAALIKELEEKSIGRPSTYAPIVSTLTERRYVKKEKKTLVPTDLGFVVTDMMEEYFKEIVDAGFTAGMEEKLDNIESTEVNADWRKVVADFYGPLEKELKIADEKIEKVKLEDTLTGEMCELCGKPLAIKHGRFGDFIACTGFPECRNTKKIQVTIGVKCPDCGKDIIVKKGKRGRTFYGCSGYPECNKVYWYKPTEKKCPKCGELLVQHAVKDTKLECPREGCGYKE
jgi:DNA topoisomerase-1